jgi:hypothetical protein
MVFSMTVIHKLISLLKAGIFFSIFTFISANLAAQKILPDTFYIPFRYDTLIEVRHICIREVVDKRDEAPNFVRYDKKNKYLLIPVDQEVYTHNPVAEEISKGIQCDTPSREFHLEIEKFSIEKYKGRFSSSLYLIADLPVFEYVNDTMIYRGTYFYDYLYTPRAKKETLEQSTENLLNAWHTEFKLGLLGLKSDFSNPLLQNSTNFITDRSVRSLYANTGVASFFGINWWGLQGEIYFMRPETNRRNHYMSGIIRYQNTKEYESFALGKQSEHYIYRRNPDWLFDIDFNFLIGFCKWKELDKYEPTLYQLFNFELSSVQSIVYNPLNRRGLTFRFGIIENMNYIIERDIQFQAGLLLGIGVKL